MSDYAKPTYQIIFSIFYRDIEKNHTKPIPGAELNHNFPELERSLKGDRSLTSNFVAGVDSLGRVK